MTAWMTVTVVSKSLTSWLIDTFMTDWSSTITNCAVASDTSAHRRPIPRPFHRPAARPSDASVTTVYTRTMDGGVSRSHTSEAAPPIGSADQNAEARITAATASA